MKMAVFWVVAPCSLVEVYQRYRGPCWLHHQGDSHLHTHRRENFKPYFAISYVSSRRTVISQYVAVTFDFFTEVGPPVSIISLLSARQEKSAESGVCMNGYAVLFQKKMRPSLQHYSYTQCTTPLDPAAGGCWAQIMLKYKVFAIRISGLRMRSEIPTPPPFCRSYFPGDFSWRARTVMVPQNSPQILCSQIIVDIFSFICYYKLLG
jgi:hypothetical protein